MPFKVLSAVILVCKTFGLQMRYVQITIYTHLNSCMQFDIKIKNELFCYSYMLYIHAFIYLEQFTLDYCLV